MSSFPLPLKMHTEHQNYNITTDQEALRKLRLSLSIYPQVLRSSAVSLSSAIVPVTPSSAPLRRIPSPSAILEDNSLWLGSLRCAQDEHLLYKLRVTHVLSIISPTTAITIPGAPHNRIHKRIDLFDTPDSDLLAILPKATSWIDKVLQDKSAVVMVHCQKGISRSAAVVVGWLMKKRRWSLGHTLDWVTKRRGVRPNDGFLRQLAMWEEMIFGEGHLLADVTSKM